MIDCKRQEECSQKQIIDKIDICGCSIEDVKVVEDTKIFKIFTEHKINFKAGQFFLLSDPKYHPNGKELCRAYSVCNSEEECRHLEFAITQLSEGNFSKHFKELKEKDRICTKEQFGVFTLKKNENATFIAGGSGMTPFMSMLRTINDQNLPIKATMIYSIKNKEQILFFEELKELNKKENIKIVFCVTREDEECDKDMTCYNKRVDKNILESNIILDSQIYLCGPKPMMDSVRIMLNEIGINEDNINQERW
jgi:ferredoxin-NADP reductase